MSHFSTIKTQISDVPALVTALSDVGYTQVEVYQEAQNLYGYRGDKRPQTAEVIVRRNFIGHASNDIGFKRQADGNFEAIISDYDRHEHSALWLNQLCQRYAYHVTRSRLAEQGFALLTEEEQTDGRIHLLVRRVV